LWRTLRKSNKGDGYFFNHKALAKVFRGKLLVALMGAGRPVLCTAFRGRRAIEPPSFGPCSVFGLGDDGRDVLLHQKLILLSLSAIALTAPSERLLSAVNRTVRF
jgi:hypothetical protein